MPREVTHTATGPRWLTPEDVDPEKGDVAVCMCGLSGEYSFCDGTHRRTEDEDPDTTYKYADGERRVVADVKYVESESDDGNVGRDASDDDSEASATETRN